jgi:hypothetical protein
MSEQERNKAGLHKEISSIFKGVPIPQTDSSQESSGTPAPERTDHIEPKPPATEPQRPEVPKPQLLPKAAPEHTDYTEPKPPAIEPQRPETPKSYQVTPSLPKAEAVQEPKTEPTHAPKFMTSQEPEVVPAQQSKVEPVQQPKVELTQQPKAEPAQRPKADIDDTDIEKNISQKGTTLTISSQTFWQRIEKKLFTPKPGVSATKQKAMVVTMPLLFIVLIFMLIKGGVFGTSVRKTEASTEDNVSSVATADSNTKIDWEIPAPYPTTLRDPMQLGPVETAQTETETETRTFVKLIVKGILYAEDNASAVIGNQIVHEGEKIRGVTVVKISQDSVEFEMNAKRWTQKVQ